MAITATITKHWPTLTDNGLFYVGVEVVLQDDDVNVPEATRTRQRTFTTATTKTADVSLVTEALADQIQNWVNTYKTEKTAYLHAKYETLRTTIASQVEV